MAVRRSDLVDGITEAVIPLKDRIKQLEHELAVQKGVVEMVYIPVRHMTERADKYEAKCKLLEAALDWAVQWVPNPTECSPVPSTEIVKIIHNAVIRPDSQADGSGGT